MKPLLPKHYVIRVEPPDNGGKETLVFTSERKRVIIAGRSFGAFVEHVVPLLDGKHELSEIQSSVSGLFDSQAVEDCLNLLARHRILEDEERVALAPEVRERLAPQIAYLREVTPDPALVIDRLADSTVTVVGIGAIGVVAATALSAANVGRIRCVDDSAVSSADPFLSQITGLGDVGRGRIDVVRDRIKAVNPATTVDVVGGELRSDDDVAAAIEGSDFVLGCLDPGLASITYKLNRACLARGVTWSTGTATAFEAIVGPTVIPDETACYLCYRMREVACSDDPAVALAELEQQDASKVDASSQRENLAFGPGIVGQLLALEAFKALTGIRPPTAGRILTIDFFSLAAKQHLVLRKPWCPACWPSGDA